MVQTRLLDSIGSAWQRADTIDASKSTYVFCSLDGAARRAIKKPRPCLLNNSPVGTVGVLPIYKKRIVAFFSWAPYPEFLRTVPGVLYARGDIVRPLCVEAYSRPSACADTLSTGLRAFANGAICAEGGSVVLIYKNYIYYSNPYTAAAVTGVGFWWLVLLYKNKP